MRIRTRVRKYKKPLKAAPTRSVMLGVGALLCALIVWVAHSEAPPRGAAAPDGVAMAPVAAGAPALAGQRQRLAYRYSVVPGGVHSRAELAGAVLRDPVVAAHYAHFDVAKARVVRLAAPQWMHVSYRVGDKIFWTGKKVMLAAGETVITDGANTARTRCGNLLSVAQMAPVMMVDAPAPEVLDTMYASAEGISEAGAAVPMGQGPAPRAADTPSVQLAAMSSGVEPTARPGIFAPPLAVLPGVDPVRTLSAPPIVLHGVVVTQPEDTPPPTDTPAPQNPPKPQDPPVSTPPQDPPGTPLIPPRSVVPPRAPTPVPEPGTASLMAGALLAMFTLRGKKRVQVRRT